MESPVPIGVIFDMDGVLVDSAAPHFESWKLLAEECGGTVTEHQFAATFGRQNRDIIPILFGQVGETRMRELSIRKEELYRALVREDTPVLPGAVNLVRELHEAGVRLAVGSSGPRENIDLVLSAMGLADRICAIVSGDEVTRGKPDPQVFLFCAERLGIEAGRCVVVEDAPVGVEAARAAGARAVAILTYHPAEAFDRLPQELRPDLVLQRLSDASVDRIVSLVA
jgi:beta-phosphoglucomutase